MKIKLLFLLLFSTVMSYSQVGINTKTPQKDFHINGSLQVVKELNVGGSFNTVGSSGNKGDILFSNGTNMAPIWSSPAGFNIPSLSVIGIKSGFSAQTNANVFATVVFTSFPLVNPAVAQYNSSDNSFTILKKGYYQILYSSYLDMSLNPVGQTGGTAQSTVKQNNQIIFASITTHNERTDNVRHTSGGTAFFNVNDKVIFQMTMTRDFRLADCSISMLYLGN
ncbi:hypothetical protein F3J23_14710 [Chryseobacterium sp. Tr-659]|uniref:hypothetical protein n=1 Tax=Chryseobacterium sp. Tr-659 TaxID=2608340 RepID=UPI001421704C|nr:hypothetical protein [Chryseobacterium sp. Tr-659]NIF06698.1 hypothetical protein [Chryseobacterium sp. Tr-659]